MTNIRDDVREVCGMGALLGELSLNEERKHTDSPLNKTIVISDGTSRKKCTWCKQLNENWCWNCEKPHCGDHARMVWIPQPKTILTLCLRCAKAVEIESICNLADEVK